MRLQRTHAPRHCMTLIEVAIASFCTLLIITACIGALVQGASMAHMSAQYAAAMCLCQERLEQMRADDFDNLTATNYGNETSIELTHTEAPSTIIIYASRQVQITDISTAGVAARRVVVTVQWRFRGRDQQERLEGIIYDIRHIL